MKIGQWCWAVFLTLILPSIAFATTSTALEKQLQEAFEAGKLKGLHSVLVQHKGEVLAEQYFPGEDQLWGKPLGVVKPNTNSLHDLRSVTKSIIGLLYGIALSEGLVPKLDESVVAQFPQYKDLNKDPKRQKILIRHVLSMQMGIEWNEDLPYTDPRNGERAMEASPDRYRYVLERPIISKPGKEWIYNGGATALLGELIAKGTGRPAHEYAKEKLFAPLGIENFSWTLAEDGVPIAASGLRLTAPDLAKIGTMIINSGKWGDRQIVSSEWLKQSFVPQAESEVLRYGYHWWLAPVGSPPRWAAGFGNGGQRLVVDSNNDLVVVVYAGNYNQPEAWRLPVQILTKFVLPTVLSAK